MKKKLDVQYFSQETFLSPKPSEPEKGCGERNNVSERTFRDRFLEKDSLEVIRFSNERIVLSNFRNTFRIWLRVRGSEAQNLW